MTKIALVTDTNASLPAEIIQKFNIIEVPIHIQFGETSYTTGLDINDKRLFEIVEESHVWPSTAAPSPNAFTKAYQQALEAGAEQIICICCSSEVSATCNAAQLGMDSFPDADITVLDSKNLSLAEGFQVLAAAEAIADGADKDEVISLVEEIQSRIHVFGALPTLKYLAMSGRMGRLAAGIGETMNIKPILTSRNGKLELLEKIRTWGKAKQRLIELGIESASGKRIEKVGLLHVNNENGVRELFESLKTALSVDVEPIVSEFTPGLSVHTGSGVIAFVLVTAKE